MSKIVERMARAMRAIIWGNDWDAIGDPCRDLYREEIRAALRAVKPEDISDEMVKVFWSAMELRPHFQAYKLRRAISAAIAAGAST